MANAGQIATAGASNETTRYTATTGLWITLGFVFFLAVLFALNAIVGSVWLARHNLWLDAVIFLLLFGVGVWLVFLGAAFLLSASKTKVELGPQAVDMLIPNWRGPTPYLPYRHIRVDYNDIAAIETRGEIYTYYVLPIAARCLSLITKDGKRYQIGYTRENAAENAFPYLELARELARRTGLPVEDRGTVRGGTRFRALLHDEPPHDAASLSAADAAALQHAEGRAWKRAMVAIVLILVGGLLFQGIRIVTATFVSAKPTAASQGRGAR